MASTFVKFTIFIWDECHSEYLFEDVEKYTAPILINSDSQNNTEHSKTDIHLLPIEKNQKQLMLTIPKVVK